MLGGFSLVSSSSVCQENVLLFKRILHKHEAQLCTKVNEFACKVQFLTHFAKKTQKTWVSPSQKLTQINFRSQEVVALCYATSANG